MIVIVSHSSKELMAPMPKYQIRPVFIPVFVVACAALHPAALAQSLFPMESCKEYVSRTKSQLEMASGCPFYNRSGRWTINLDAHAQWCQRAAPIARASEDAARRFDLRTCTGPAGHAVIADCDDYAARAMSQTDLQETKACGYTGGRWARNFNEHKSWCARSQPAALESEDFQRRVALNACKPGQQSASPSPPGGVCDGAPTPDMQLLCREHNRVRANHCTPPLTWSARLAADAQASADRCPTDHDRAELQRQNENENLFNGFGSSAYTGPQAAFNFWYGEKANYDFQNPVLIFDPKEGPVNGHFTQVVWRSTGNIGCGVKVCGNKTFYSCRYQAPGNYNAHVGFGVDAATARASLQANVLNDSACTRGFRAPAR